jgi:predicted DNA-binding antitoxin AbrB/MazE fold protein
MVTDQLGDYVMTFQIDAIYDGGVLRPLEPLNLLDQTRVTLYVEPSSEQVSAEVLAAQQAAGRARRTSKDDRRAAAASQ